VSVETAAEMHREVLARADACELLVAVAAVADYRPAAPAPRKLKREARPLSLALERPGHPRRRRAPAPASLHGRLRRGDRRPGGQRTQELEAKSLDLIAANWVGRDGVGFEAEENALTLYWAGGSRELARAPKPALARTLVEAIAERLRASGRT